MKKMVKIILLGLLGFSVHAFANSCCTGLATGNKQGSVTLTPSIGYYYFSTTRHIENTGISSLALAYNFTPRWAIEGSVGVMNTNQSVNYPAPGVHGVLYSMDGVYRFTSYKIMQPYVAAGLGVLHLSANNNLNAPDQANAQAGAGVQLFFTERMAFRGEARDIYTFVGGKNDVMLNLGLSILFC